MEEIVRPIAFQELDGIILNQIWNHLENKEPLVVSIRDIFAWKLAISKTHPKMEFHFNREDVIRYMNYNPGFHRTDDQHSTDPGNMSWKLTMDWMMTSLYPDIFKIVLWRFFDMHNCPPEIRELLDLPETIITAEQEVQE